MWKGTIKWNQCVWIEFISERHSIYACPHLMIWNFPEHNNLLSYFLEKAKMTLSRNRQKKEPGRRNGQLNTGEKWLSWDNFPRECQCQTLDHAMILLTLLPLIIFTWEREVYRRVGQLHLEADRSTWWELICKPTRSSNAVLPTHCHQYVMVLQLFI